MKVLQINAVNKTGSTGRAAYELAEALKQDGDIALIACSISSGDEKEYLIGSLLDHKIHALLSRIFGLQGYFSKISTKKLIRYIETEQPEIVCIENVHSNYIDMPQILRYLAMRDIPTVLVLHDAWFYTGHCFHYTRIKCEKWKNGCKKCPQIHGCNESWLFDTSAKMWEDKKKLFEQIPRLAVVGVSDWITREAEQSILSKAKVVQRIYNWIDLTKFYPRDRKKRMTIREKYGIENQFLIIGVASSWDEGKGIGRFQELAGMLNDNYKVLLVGNMSPKINLSRKIISVEHTDSIDELADLYSAADVFVTLSYEESFGKVSAEALACGTPVICYNTTANPELVDEGTGIVVDSDSVKAVYDAIKIVRQNGKDFYSKNCVDSARKKFDLKKNVAEYKKLFEELLRGKKDV